jgi:hypothetical protein
LLFQNALINRESSTTMILQSMDLRKATNKSQQVSRATIQGRRLKTWPIDTRRNGCGILKVLAFQIVLSLALLHNKARGDQVTGPDQPDIQPEEQKGLRLGADTQAPAGTAEIPVGPFLAGGHRQAKLDEGDGFIMRTSSSSDTSAEHYANESAEAAPAAGAGSDEKTAELTTAADQRVATTTESDRIPINATREQFLTHDQLVNASAKDEQHPAGEQALKSSLAEPSASSRSGMPRLAFASSFLSGKCNSRVCVISV